MSSEATEASAISPLRTPRERAWPRPMILRAPAGLTSPTTAQILEVPISKPTIIEDGSNIFFLVTGWFEDFLRGHRDKAGFEPAGRQIIRNGKIDGGQVLARCLPMIIDQ